MSNINTNAGSSGLLGANESGFSSSASGSVTPQLLQKNPSASSFQPTHQSQMHLHQHQTPHQHVVPSNGLPQSQMYLNNNMAQAAAFQQFIQEQMSLAQNNGNNIPQNPVIQGANGLGFNHDAMNMNMGGAQMNAQIAAYAQQMQQNQLNAQTQAQIAAILAASVGNNMMFNQGQQASAPPAFAAAQAFALMMSQQQAMANHQQQSMQAPATIPTHQQQTQSPATQVKTQVAQPQQINVELKHSSSPQPRLLKAITRTPTPTVQQSAQKENSSQGPKRKKVKKQQKQKEVCVSRTPVPQVQHINHGSTSSFGHPTVKQLPVPPFQMPAARNSQLASVHHNSMPVPQHGHGMFQPNINPIVLTQMQSWKLNQLGK